MDPQTPFRYILIAFDGSDSSRKALRAGLAMALAFGARVALVSVEEFIPHYPGTVSEVQAESERQHEYYTRIHREARDEAKLLGTEFERADILLGHVAQTIINHASEIQCDLIVMGHSGRSGVWGRFLGTTADKVSRYAHCAVLIVR
ncbi:MAG: universal stress protein [Chloroflexi bacterium]|nr:universal stress protein [Chloroflexota bacterium]